MPFNSEVRTESLVRAARHCCVCHRYKGLKVEVHHIIQEADDGPNTLENAITLCADCHTDAGHYNDRHPRGTKFRPDELRRARDRWHELVASGFATQSADAGSLYCRYLLCKNFESIREICSGNLSDFPFKNSLLVRTPALDFLTSIVTQNNGEEAFSLKRNTFRRTLMRKNQMKFLGIVDTVCAIREIQRLKKYKKMWPMPTTLRRNY